MNRSGLIACTDETGSETGETDETSETGETDETSM